MDILNNREIAVALWLLVAAIYFSLSARMSEDRKSFSPVLKAFFAKPVMSVLLCMIFYILLEIYLLSEIELWNVDQIKNTIFWSVSVGFTSMFKLKKIKSGGSFFKSSVYDNIKLLALLQFIIGVYTFPLIVEIILAPILFLVSALLAFSDTDKKYKSVNKIMQGILTSFGFIIIIYTVYMLLADFNEFGQEKTFYDFIVPTLLTILFLPFIFIMLIYTTYQTTFIRINGLVNNKKLRAVTKVYALILFNFRLRILDRWFNYINIVGISSYSELVDSIKHISKVKRSEANPQKVDPKLGWSPYIAKNFLLERGIQTNYYDKIYDNEWFASSPLENISEGFLPDNITYYVEGNETVSKVLKIKLNINDYSRSKESIKVLLEHARVLSKKSLEKELTYKMVKAIEQCKEHSENIGNKIIKTEIYEWPNHKLNGFDIKFIVTSI